MIDPDTRRAPLTQVIDRFSLPYDVLTDKRQLFNIKIRSFDHLIIYYLKGEERHIHCPQNNFLHKSLY